MACQLPDTSLNEFTDENLSFIDMELEALQSIFINELEVKENEKCTTISIDLYPSTADKLDEQYVRMTLEFALDEEYPMKIPDIKIRNPRGLSDEELNSIIEDLVMIAERKKGSSMLFEMIDAAKEHLTVGNRPSGECAICLHGFSDSDIFTKTECYHYFHSHCLARYAKNFFETSKNCEEDAENKSKSDELLCPMCRIQIEFDEWDADYPPPEESDECDFTLSEEMIDLQKKMAALFQMQVEKGGIIDIQAEKNKYLLEISNVPSRLNSEEQSEPAAEGDSVNISKNEPSQEIDSPAFHRKERTGDQTRKFDHRPRNRNFNRPNESRSNNRYDYRYNKQSFNRGNYNKYRYRKHNSENSYQDESESLQCSENKDSSAFQDIKKDEDLNTSSPDIIEHDDASETSEHPSPKPRSNYNPSFSPRYKNRGYHYGQNNYNNDTRRYNKSGYNDRRGSQASHRYSVQRVEESHTKFEKRNEGDFVDHYNRKSDYRSGSYKRDNEYYTKPRYTDNRNNSYHGYKGAYNGRDDYSNSYNSRRNNRYGDPKDRENYPEKNRYGDSKDKVEDREHYPERNKYGDSKVREHYSERNRYENSKDRENYSERNRYENSKDKEHYPGKNTHENSKDREHYPERNRHENSKDREHYPERNRLENSKDREHYPERNRHENSKDREHYPERNRLENSKDREHYPERNYREKQTYNDVRYRNNDDHGYNRSKQASRNYSGTRPDRYSDRSYAKPSSTNNESKLLESNNQNQNGDHDVLPTENGSLSSSNSPQESSQKEKSFHKKNVADVEESSSNTVSAFSSSSSNILPNAFGENSDITPKTVNPPPGFANPLKKVVYGLQGANPPPGFNRS